MLVSSKIQITRFSLTRVDGVVISHGDTVRHREDEPGINMDGLVSGFTADGGCEVFYSDSYDGPCTIPATDLVVVWAR